MNQADTHSTMPEGSPAGSFGVLVRDGRKKLRMSQSRFAVFLGLPLNSLRAWEQDRKVPSEATLNFLRVALARPDVIREVLHTSKNSS